MPCAPQWPMRACWGSGTSASSSSRSSTGPATRSPARPRPSPGSGATSSSSTATGSREELAGINTRADLAQMETKLRAEIVERWMAAGVTFDDPATAYVGPEVTIGRDTVIGPNVQLRGRTRIGEGCRLDGTVYLVDTTLGDRVHLLFGCVADGAEVGPDARV